MKPLRLRTWFLLLAAPLAGLDAAESFPLGFRVQLDVVKQELDPAFCWFHPRVAALPGFGNEGQPAVIMTLQKHLIVSDHYSGLYFMRTDDLGKTWSGPDEIPELAWQKSGQDETIAVCDVTPGWHEPSRRMIAIGTKLRYDAKGAHLLDKPRSHECAYAIFDPEKGSWTSWNMLAMPETDGKFFLVAPGCVQWLVQRDGTILLPIYFKGATGNDYTVTVLRCSFDGREMKLLEQGAELTVPGGRGLCEPSLAAFDGRYFLTMRNDARGYVTTSDDGLAWAPMQPWRFDDGGDLGSYNTQQHWLVHSDGLFLSYTRRGANNDHIPRNRAPIFLAQVDPATLRVMRSTEQAIIPERGAMLGNFGTARINEGESWVTDSEFINDGRAHPRGANGTTFAARVRWSKPNKLSP